MDWTHYRVSGSVCLQLLLWCLNVTLLVRCLF
jgi:hypothetical protein